jgi:hypothetical protein
MILRAYSPGNAPKHCSPFGAVDDDHIYIGSITLERSGGKGIISQEQALEILQRTMELSDFEIAIKAENIEIVITNGDY